MFNSFAQCTSGFIINIFSSHQKNEDFHVLKFTAHNFLWIQHYFEFEWNKVKKQKISNSQKTFFANEKLFINEKFVSEKINLEI